MEDISSLVRASVNVIIPLQLSNEGKNERAKSFARLMQALHRVKDLYISVPNLAGNTNWWQPTHVPGCVYSCLKGISVGSFDDDEDEFAMLSYILENARVLQTVKLRASIQAKYRMLQRITKFPRKSQACQIDFV
ncbi:putative FBD-associated F-box protein At5g56440 [Lycium barbarum]|uniref:putative FBD-associated F-box protein At5g56440 n=1 Tax=Lycium barbarum TaxID=112863 RepID=UPI00293E4E9A|nr:putative FBD-associated F-box protein At5g56440 [Lycium barbarum]